MASNFYKTDFISEKKIVAVFYSNISISLLNLKPIFGMESSLNIKQIF